MPQVPDWPECHECLMSWSVTVSMWVWQCDLVVLLTLTQRHGCMLVWRWLFWSSCYLWLCSFTAGSLLNQRVRQQDAHTHTHTPGLMATQWAASSLPEFPPHMKLEVDQWVRGDSAEGQSASRTVHIHCYSDDCLFFDTIKDKNNQWKKSSCKQLGQKLMSTSEAMSKSTRSL